MIKITRSRKISLLFSVLLLAFAFTAFYSCSPRLLIGRSVALVMKTGTERITVLENDSLEKKIVMVPMNHLKTKKHYEAVKIYLDSLKQDGYVVFYEGVRYATTFNTKEDSLFHNTVVRKYRKISGPHSWNTLVDMNARFDKDAAKKRSKKTDEYTKAELLLFFAPLFSSIFEF